MSKSIFSRYFSAFVVIIIATFILLSLVLSETLADYYNRTSKQKLVSSAETLKQLFEEQYSFKDDEDFKEYVNFQSINIRRFLNDHLRIAGSDYSAFLTDEKGEILISANLEENDFSGDKVGDDIMRSIGDSIYEEEGNLSGLFRMKKAVYGIPIARNGVQRGVLFVCTVSTGMSYLNNTTIRTVIVTCLWTMLAALVAVYILTKRITLPLYKMSEAAKEFEHGHFDVRVPIPATDELAELGTAINNMAQSLQILDKNRSDFLSSVSHDLRTPMTTITGFIDAILDGTIPEEKQEYYIKLIGNEVKRLSRLVTALLDVTRIQSGERKFVMTSFDICEMARIILISFEQKIEGKKLDVEFETDEDKMFVTADRDAIYQILYNLCDNAVKFSREGGKYRIKIEKPDKKIRVSVYNEGAGIPEEDVPRVFERFFKSDRSRGMDKTGTGLGLYIAKSIINAHGEEIKVESTQGEYCEFTFTLRPSTETEIKTIAAQQ
ncbi:MAG: HAMP domain-containing histidine kinase [Firmicutes bacterium]|nr:HAMP domain-containing histidine kinase [Candidatus Colimorpha enterica]